MDFLTRQIYKQDLIALDIRNIISKYIEYDDTIESNCEDCNQLLLIDDIRKCRGKIFNKWESIPGSMPGRCHKRCCDNCLKCNVYKPIAKSKKQKFKHLLAYQCCKNCYKNNNNKYDYENFMTPLLSDYTKNFIEISFLKLLYINNFISSLDVDTKIKIFNDFLHFIFV